MKRTRNAAAPGAAPEPHKPAARPPSPCCCGLRPTVVLCVLVASSFSFLLGYDIGIMSGAKRLVLRDLGLATEQVEVLVGTLNLVSGFGGLAAGRLADGVGRRRTGALAWTLSAHDTVASDFEWLGDDAKMYDVHGAYLIEELDLADDAGTNASARGVHRLLAFDGGNNRPGCEVNYTNCYSRAVEYELDFERMQARVSWEFEFPRSVSLTNATAGVGHLSDLSNPGTTLRSIEKTDYYLNDGGSVYTLGNGNYVVSFTYIDNVFGDTQWPNATRTFEVDARGQAIAELITPGTWRNYRNGAWRAIPFDSVCGETAECPAEMSDEQCGELT